MPKSVRLPAELESQLARYCVARDITASEVIRLSVERFLAEQDVNTTLYDLGSDLFGADDAPAGKAVSADYKRLLAEKLREKHSR